MTTALGPDIDEDWIAKFAAGLAADQQEYGISLMGGDTVATPGPTTLSVTALGIVPTGRALRRRGAQARRSPLRQRHDRRRHPRAEGAAGAELLDLGFAPSRAPGRPLSSAAAARWRSGAALLAGGAVTAAMDVSDGLVADAGHIAEASHCGLDHPRRSRAALRRRAGGPGRTISICCRCCSAAATITRSCSPVGAGFTAPEPASIAEIGEVVSGSGVKCWTATARNSR